MSLYGGIKFTSTSADLDKKPEQPAANKSSAPPSSSAAAGPSPSSSSSSELKPVAKAAGWSDALKFAPRLNKPKSAAAASRAGITAYAASATVIETQPVLVKPEGSRREGEGSDEVVLGPDGKPLKMAPSMIIVESEDGKGKKRDRGGDGREGKKRKKKKKKNQHVVPLFDPEDLYDPNRPNDLGEYQAYRKRVKEEKRMHLLEEKRRRAAGEETESSEYESSEEEAPRRDAPKLWAPPRAYGGTARPSSPPRPKFQAPPLRRSPSPPPPSSAPPPPPPPPSSSHPATGDDAYARRLALSQAASGDDAYARRAALSQPAPATGDDAFARRAAISGDDAYARRAGLGQAPPPPPTPLGMPPFPPPPNNLGAMPPFPPPPPPPSFIAPAPPPPPPPPVVSGIPGFGSWAAPAPPAIVPQPSPPPSAPVPAAPSSSSSSSSAPGQISSEDFAKILEERKRAAEAIAAKFKNLPGAPKPVVPLTEVEGKSFAEKFMRRLGHQEGQGLGARGDGMVHALAAEHVAPDAIIRTHDAKGNPLSKRAIAKQKAQAANLKNKKWVQHATSRGKIVDLQEDERRKMEKEKVGEASRVVVLRNVVGGEEEIEEGLGDEVGDECSKYGIVERVVLHMVEPPPDDPAECLRIFVVFSGMAGAWRSVRELDGRYFGGRQIKAAYFDEGKFDRGDRDGDIM